MPKYFLLTVLFFLSLKSFSQNRITGTIKDNTENLLMGATVVIKTQNSKYFLSYSISNSKGEFSIEIDSNSQNLVISVSYLGYKTYTKIITNFSQDIIVVLEESQEELKEVIVNSYNIKKKGDTLSYSVSAFKDQKDKSIADVLKKMPGIDILPSGQIYYLGAPIEKYYIEGMDMLEGRYNLANDNISAADVSKVQILENHQPVKVLDSLVFSEKTSLNIKLKKNTSITGTAEIGGGLSPALLKTNITPLLFTKKSQALISYQYNNTGTDLVRSNNSFSTSSSLGNTFSASKKKLLSLRELSKPPFKSERWLNNNDHLGSVNYLYRLKKNIDLKINLSYLNGVRIEKGTRNTTYIPQNDTINYSENIENKLFLNSLNTKFVLERNLSKSYIRNAFDVKAFWDSQKGFVLNNDIETLQELSNPYLLLTNQFKLIKPVGKQLITFRSETGYTKTNQELIVSPGQFVDLLNNGEVYDNNRQLAGLTSFFTNNTAGFTKKTGVFVMSPEMGFGYQNQMLTSELLKFFNGNHSGVGNDFVNDLELTSSNFYVTNQLKFNKNNWKISLNLPLYLRYFKTVNRVTNQQKAISKFNFEPYLSITKKLSPYWETNFTGLIENKFGDIDNLFDGYMLVNYLQLLRYNSTLSEATNYTSLVSIKYRDAIKAIFGNLSFKYNKSLKNLLYNYSISDEGLLVIESIERDNEVTTKSIDFNTSKYFNKIKTTLRIGGRFLFSERTQIVNKAFGLYKNLDWQYDLDIESEITKGLSLGGSFSNTISELRSSNDQVNRVTNWRNSISTFFYVNKYNLFNIEAEHYYNNIVTSNNTNYFLNLCYQFTLKKYNLDTKIVWNNILNTKNYINVYNGEFFSNENSFVLRPSQFLISLKFSL